MVAPKYANWKEKWVQNNEKVALLKDQPAEELFENVKSRLVFTPGAKRLCACLRTVSYTHLTLPTKA